MTTPIALFVCPQGRAGSNSSGPWHARRRRSGFFEQRRTPSADEIHGFAACPNGHRTGPWQLLVTPSGQRNRGGRWQAAKVSAYAEPEQISDMEQSDDLMRLGVTGWLGISRRLNCGAISVTDTAAADLEGIGAAKNPPGHLIWGAPVELSSTQGQTAASRMTTDSNGLACDAPSLPATPRNANC